MKLLRNRLLIFAIIGGFTLWAGYLILHHPPQTQTNNEETANEPTVAIETNDEMYLGQQPTLEDISNDPCANWILKSAKSDVLIHLTIADGVEKDTSYEAGFALSAIERDARIARGGEYGYCTGFSYDELKNLGTVQVAVWGYTDSRRRNIVNEPMNVTFDESGHPNVSSPIEVTVLD